MGVQQYTLILICLIISAIAQSQEKAEVYGTIYDGKGKPFYGVSIAVAGTSTGTISKEDGTYSLQVPTGKDIVLAFSYLGYENQQKNIRLNPDTRFKIDLTMELKTITFKTFTIEDEQNRATPMTKIDPRVLSVIPSASGNFESILFSQASVSSNNELSSQYSVRGGNFDENLVYVNGIEIYRPFLIRSGQQEGLSFINSDMVASIQFSAGGFESKYGDKMSSVLDITYKKPAKFEGSVTASLLGGSVYVGDASKNHRFTQLHGIRYKTNRYVLNSLDTQGDYQPSFVDYQGYFTYDLTEKLELSFLGNISGNKFQFTPTTRRSDFGTINQGLRLTVFFDGQETDVFNTYLGAFSANYKPNKNMFLKFTSSVFKTYEEETFDILGQYWLDELNRDLSSEDFGDVAFNRGVGSFLDHGRNKLEALIYNLEHKGSYAGDDQKLLWGIKFQQELIEDKLNEWTMLDSAGYSIPQAPADEIQLSESYFAENSVVSERFSGYLQANKNWELKNNAEVFLTTGSRFNYWTFSEELLISPRITLAYQPNWEKDVVFKMAWGYYHQPAFYREMRNLNGEINKNIKAQQSIHYVLGSDFNFKIWERPFKLTNELYYKQMDNLIPYERDNVRIRYYATNNARGYAVGFETKLHGEFVKDVDSWASIAVMSIKEDLRDDYYIEYQDAEGNRVIPYWDGTASITDTVRYEPGYIPRPTDQRVNFGLFFQDYIPKHPNYKMHLNLLYGTGLPTGPPSFERYKDTLRLPPYRRVDIGFSFQLLSEKSETREKSPLKVFKSVWLSAEVFNLLQINNTISYLWIKDVTGSQYAVPNYLTSRRLNLKLVARF